MGKSVRIQNRIFTRGVRIHFRIRETNARVRELLTSEKLCNRQGATANTVNDMVIWDFRQYPDQLRPKDVNEGVEILLPSVVLATVNKLPRETWFKVLAHV